LCRSERDITLAFQALGGPVVAKGCSPHVPHKSEHGLVKLAISSVADAIEAYRTIAQALAALRVESDGVILARMVTGAHELALGARVDSSFGPVVMIGAGGKYVEALGDVQFLLPPFTESDAADALARLRMSPLLRGVRGEAPTQLAAVCATAVRLGDLILSCQNAIASIDINPLMLGGPRQGVTVVDAVVERASVEARDQ
jgi:succinyl-CoA synthetase beta subunit